MSRPFPRDSTLSSPSFSSYKLSPSLSLPPPTVHPLPAGPASPARLPSTSTSRVLSPREVAARVAHDHLAAGFGGWVLWVDQALTVCAAKVSSDPAEPPIFSALCTLPPPPISSSSPPAEYPSVHALTPTTYLVSDGHGRAYPLLVRPSSTSLFGALAHPYALPSSLAPLPAPFKVEWAGGERQLLVSTVARGLPPKGKAGQAGREQGFLLALVSFPDDWADGLILPTSDSDDDSDDDVGAPGDEGRKVEEKEKEEEGERELDVQWTVSGSDLPFYADFDQGHFLLASSAPYISASSASLSLSSSLAPPIPSPALVPHLRPTQTPFSWTQTSTSLTLSIPLPATTTLTQIHLPFHPSILSLSLSSAPVPGLDGRKWWDGIRAGASTWTWDSEGALLELELEKRNQGTRWPSLFRTEGSGRDGEEEVQETMTGERREAIRESLEKFTGDLDEGDGPSPSLAGLGGLSSLNRGFSSLMSDSDDELTSGGGGEGDEDAAGAGKRVFFSFVDRASGAVRALSGEETLLGKGLEWTKDGWAGRRGQGMRELMIAHSVDGLVFRPPAEGQASFQHALTFPALSFVLASKRSLQYTLFTSSSSSSSASPSPSPGLVLAFTAPSTPLARGDLLLYSAPAQPQAPTAASGVLKFGGGEDEGALLGVKGVRLLPKEGGEEREMSVLVGLCERALVVVRGLV